MEDDLKKYSKVLMPQYETTMMEKYYDYEETILDYESLSELNKAVNQARLGLFRITDKINEYERLESKAKLKYDRTLRRHYLSSTQKTESAKRAFAELKCEELENTYIAYQQVKNDLVRSANTIRLELQTLQAIGNNLRQQLKI